METIGALGHEACREWVPDGGSLGEEVKAGMGIGRDNPCRKHDMIHLGEVSAGKEGRDMRKWILTVIVDVSITVHLFLLTPMQIYWYTQFEQKQSMN